MMLMMIRDRRLKMVDLWQYLVELETAAFVDICSNSLGFSFYVKQRMYDFFYEIPSYVIVLFRKYVISSLPDGEIIVTPMYVKFLF